MPPTSLRSLPLVLAPLIACGGAQAGVSGDESPLTVVPVEDVAFDALNPARGDASPQAGTLWGDRGADVATGFLLRPVDGFESPPHIHNVSYRGVVISGELHNDDPTAAEMWMGAGANWTQPFGESHITAARGDDALAYIEIDAGPYLVHPADEAFDGGERPVNVVADNLVWVDASQLGWDAPSGSEVALLWGDPDGREGANGLLVRLEAGSAATLHARAGFHAVVVSGSARAEQSAPLAPGSYVGSSGARSTALTCVDGDECTLYVRSDSPVELSR